MQLASNDYEGREFPMSYQNFVRIKQAAYRLTGIKLSDHKQNMVYGRLARRLRILGIHSFDDYCDLLEDSSPEVNEFVNAITTNLTAFFENNITLIFKDQSAAGAIKD